MITVLCIKSLSFDPHYCVMFQSTARQCNLLEFLSIKGTAGHIQYELRALIIKPVHSKKKRITAQRVAVALVNTIPGVGVPKMLQVEKTLLSVLCLVPIRSQLACVPRTGVCIAQDECCLKER